MLEDERLVSPIQSGVPHYEVKMPVKKKEPARLKQLKTSGSIGKFKNGTLRISKKALGL
jgi:hypothetical protein